MTPAVTFHVTGSPVGYSRDGAALRYTPKAVTQWRGMVALSYTDALARIRSGVPLADSPPDMGAYLGLVAVTITATGAKGDADNIAKEVLDALLGLAYRDDCQVSSLCVMLPMRQLGPGGGVKKPREASGVDVTVQFLGEGFGA